MLKYAYKKPKQIQLQEEWKMKIAIGCDPNAQSEKEALIKFIEAKGYGEIGRAHV